jgi:hypothetical protein
MPWPWEGGKPRKNKHIIKNTSFRLRQLRVRNDSCVVSLVMQDMRRNLSKPNPSECYDHYSSSIEDRNNFGIGLNRKWQPLDMTNFNPEKNRHTDLSAYEFRVTYMFS